MSGALVGASIALLLASGGQPLFPPSLSLKENRADTSFAYAATASTAVVGEATGRSYVDHVGENDLRTGVPAGGYPLCTPDTLARFVRDRRDFCMVAKGSWGVGDCRWRAWCAPVIVAPELARDPRWGPVIEHALRQPCAVLSSPYEMTKTERRRKARGLIFSQLGLWREMKCSPFRSRRIVRLEYQEAYSAYFAHYR